MSPLAGLAGLHVLMTTDAIGGVWTYSLDLARGLAAAGIGTSLLVLGPGPAPEQERAAATAPGLRLLVPGLPLDWLAERPEAVTAAGQAVADIASATGAAIVHLNSPALAARARFAVPVVGVCHSCLATWWDAVRGGPMPPDFEWRTALLAQGYAEVDTLIAPSAAFGTATAGRYRLRQAPVTVHNGRLAVAPETCVTGAIDAAFTAGRLWDEGKNLSTLDQAVADLDLPVLAAGPTSGPNGAGIALRHLRLLGQLQDSAVAEHLARQPIFVSTALYEPFGLAVLEAAQAGCALVLSDIAAFRELWGDAADFVPPRDACAIRNALQRMRRDRERRRDFGVAARERARRYSLDAMTAGVLDVYRQALRGAGAPAGRGAAA